MSSSWTANFVNVNGTEHDGKKSEGMQKPDQAAKKASTKRDYAAWAAATPENRAQPPRFVNSATAPGVFGIASYICSQGVWC